MAQGVACGLHRRPRRQPGRLVRAPPRPLLGAAGAGRRRRAARLPERLPPPGQHHLRGLGVRCDRASLPVPPLGVGPGRPAARGSVAAGLRAAAQRRAGAGAGAGGHLDPPGVREPGPRRRAAGRLAGGRPRRHRLGRPRRVPVRLLHRHPGQQQLEGGQRRLLGDLPRAGPAPGDAGQHRRRQRPPADLETPQRLIPALRRAQPPPGPQRRRPGGVGLLRDDRGRAHGTGLPRTLRRP